MRGALLALFLLLIPAAARATSEQLCERLFVPPGYGLLCEDLPGEGEDSRKAEVRPVEGSFAEFSRLTVRHLRPEGIDRLAWEDGDAWLEAQMRIDMGAYAESLRALTRDPDNPLSADGMRQAIKALASALEKLGGLALAACDRPTRTAGGQRVLRCRFGSKPLALYIQVRLVEDGEQRYAINIRTLSARRLRHFEAIANSFTLG